MKKKAVSALVLLSMLPLRAEVPAEPPARAGELLFSDDFSAANQEWKAVIPSLQIRDGVLRVWQTRDDHGAVSRVYRPMKDVIVTFRFKLDGSTGFNAVFDDKNHKGSHAGHICRVAFAPTQIRLGDDKEGIMRNDLFAMRGDPAKKEELQKLTAHRGAAFSHKLTPGEWHEVAIEILGDRMRVSCDGKPIGSLQSPGIAHETKQSFHFTVNGSGVLFDDLKIHEAR